MTLRLAILLRTPAHKLRWPLLTLGFNALVIGLKLQAMKTQDWHYFPGTDFYFYAGGVLLVGLAMFSLPIWMAGRRAWYIALLVAITGVVWTVCGYLPPHPPYVMGGSL